MDRLLALACFAIGVAFVAIGFLDGGVEIGFLDGGVAVLTATAVTLVGVWLIRFSSPEHSEFLTRIFIVAMLARLGFGLVVHFFDLRDFFGGDAETYDAYGNMVLESWFGKQFDPYETIRLDLRVSGVGWGMLYLVAGLYAVVGRNILAAQSFCAVIGAGIAPLVYLCSFKIFSNVRAAKIAAIAAALYPAFIIWTSQLMKDGLIIFLLTVAVLMVLQLQDKFTLKHVGILIFSLFGIISLRFYIFYMIALAVVGSFLVVRESSPKIIARNFMILVLVGFVLTYVGVIRYASSEFEKYGDLERVQMGRQDLANRADSGFGKDVDVSTVEGAISAIPLGLAYLLLAPFPWQMTNLRQTITMPDMVIWWTSLPFLIGGLFYALRKRLRGSIGILIFTVMLSLAYAIFQGNVGTAYRQRTQIQVFLFVFVGVGVTLYLEKRENRKALRDARNMRPRSLKP